VNASHLGGCGTQNVNRHAQRGEPLHVIGAISSAPGSPAGRTSPALVLSVRRSGLKALRDLHPETLVQGNRGVVRALDLQLDG
jgi:hypothetical protein